MNTFSPLILPALNGFLLSYYLLKTIPIRYKALLLLTLSLPLGFLSTSLIMFWAYTTHGFKQNLVAIHYHYILCAALLIPILRRDWQNPIKNVWKNLASSLDDIRRKILGIINLKRKELLELLGKITTALLFFSSILYFLRYYVGNASWNPIGGWDAQYLWNVKAHFYFRAPEYWRNMYANIVAGWFLPDYPHFLPGSVAWGWIWVQKEILIWPIIVSAIFPLAICLIVLWYFASEVSLWVGFLAASFFLMVPTYQFWSTTQYADIPLSFFITTSTLFFTLAARKQENKLFLISGLFAGSAFWTKNEGILFTACLTVIFGIFLLISKELKYETKKKIALYFILGLSIPILTTIYLKIHYGGGGIYLGSKRSLGEYVKLLSDFTKTKLIAVYFIFFKSNFQEWRGLWALFYLAIVLGGKDLVKNKRWIILAMVCLIDLGYAFVFHITPIELKFHIQTSLLRLLQHTAVLALVFATEIFAASIPNLRKN